MLEMMAEYNDGRINDGGINAGEMKYGEMKYGGMNDSGINYGSAKTSFGPVAKLFQLRGCLRKYRKFWHYVAHPPQIEIGANGAKPVEMG
jgi:hypothetical protein